MNQPAAPRPVRPVAPSPVSHLIRLPASGDHRLFGGWGVKL